MTGLIYLRSKHVLKNLKIRYEQDLIYTSISKILIAVNPYQKLDLYDDDTLLKYRSHAEATYRNKIDAHPLPPHVFSTAATGYNNLRKTGVNQSMIVCGESGSGKTESAKYLIR